MGGSILSAGGPPPARRETACHEQASLPDTQTHPNTRIMLIRAFQFLSAEYQFEQVCVIKLKQNCAIPIKKLFGV